MPKSCPEVNEDGRQCVLDTPHFEEHCSDPYPIPGWVGETKPLVMRARWPLDVKPKRTRKRTT